MKEPLKQSMNTNMHLYNKLYDQLPAFADVFDEETFLIFAIFFTILTCIATFIASRFVVLKPANL